MITTEDLCKAYNGKPVLSNVSVGFPAGKLTSLIGPNGAGKSTLLMLVARLLEPTSGAIRIGDRTVLDFRPREYATRVATLRQAPDINLRLTVEELVAFGRFPYTRGSLDACDQREIDEALAFLSLDELRERYIDELSGGQRQMAFLAMTVAQQTDCLLLDEPLNNLDMKHSVQIMRALRRLCDERGRTVVMVVHDINFAANYSDYIVAMKGGTVCFSGQAAEVISEHRLRELYELDFEIMRTARGCVCNYFKPAGESR
ncbi:UNVERIFIED_CONTAM: ATP-binding cassette domain-containing protein [Pseudomonas aeruginosa]|uniref:iron ABC transporter ATP-binding protein n=1 Tax=Pseudomonas aeruginosa TaxID=287 RepID=UPI000FD515E9|nr:ATP-binding cassette domain-containing protein [Pseudomonas aeruginosa]RUC47637.1 ATP-binding cassette domain-containing protein [Pseudomonas aeruginosa]HEJ1339703.1 ATP-binding cassette domain-containing protein [Pseudomonas aeruginosa]